MISFIYDVAGWAWHHKATALSRWLVGSAAVAEADVHMNVPDAAVCFSPAQFARLRPFLDPARTLVGASFPDEVAELASLAKRAGVAGVFVNNLRMATALRVAGLPVFVCPNGVDEAFFTPADPLGISKPRDHSTSTLTVGWIGNSAHRGNGHKGIYDIVAKGALMAGVALLGHDTCGDYTGHATWSPREIRDDILRRIDVLAVGSQLEGTPNPALEALSCGVPVIGTPVGNLPELIRDDLNGIVVDRSAEAFAVVLAALKHDPARLARWKAHARPTVLQGWTWRAQAEAYRRMVAQALPDAVDAACAVS